jgi:hypothetical protein
MRIINAIILLMMMLGVNGVNPVFSEKKYSIFDFALFEVSPLIGAGGVFGEMGQPAVGYFGLPGFPGGLSLVDLSLGQLYI